MCKKLIYLLSLVFVLSPVLTGSANAADPNLVGWWKFDGDANDSSGNDHHGSLQGDAGFAAGVLDQAVKLGGGGDYVNIDGYKGVTGTHAFSITAWVKRMTDRYGVIVSWGADETGERVWFLVHPEDGGELRFSPGTGGLQSNANVSIEQWYHVAVTVPSVRSNAKLYIDGQDVTSGSFSTLNIVAEPDVGIGWNASRQRSYFNGLIDDVRIYDKELLPAEVGKLAGNVEPFLLEPANEAILAAASPLLKWTPGVYAADVNGHEVYLSDIFEDVNDSNDDALLDTLSGDSNAYLAGGLDVNTTYYWKVDAVNDSHPDNRWSSEIWSFFVPPYEAWNESPADGTKYVPTYADLFWSIGLGAVSHQVYFGTNFNDVNTDSGAAPQSEPNYDPGTMAYDTNYYWRVDEYDGSDTHRGAVWIFKTGPSFPITDPNRVCWWKLDDVDSGVTAVDWSGHDNHGALQNGASFVDGLLDEAVALDGIDDQVMYSFAAETWPAYTVTLWVKATTLGQDVWSGVFSSFNSSSSGFQIDVDGEDPGNYRLQGYDTGQGDFGPVTTDWVHLAVTCDGNDNDVLLYYNGNLVTTIGPPEDMLFNKFCLGNNRGEANWFAGTIDEVHIYDRALSHGEVQNSMDPSRASCPSPDDGALDVPVSAKLIWSPGTDESTGSPYTRHDLYFSTNFEDVNAGTVTPIELDVNYYDPDLDYVNVHRKSYYWRVDEVNDSNVPYRGWLWSFRTTYDPCAVVDPNLLAWYEFDGDATDSSGRCRDLTEFGEPAYTDGFEDQAIDLDGIDDHAVYEFPTEDKLTYTVTAWVRANTLGQSINSSVFSSHRPNTNGFQLDVDGTDPGNYRYNDGFDKLLGPVTTGWVHLAVTSNGTQTSTFYNGSFVDSNTPSDVAFNRYAVGINRGGNNWFEGAVDEVRIYDKVLSDPEIVAVMRIDLARAWMPRPVDGATGVPLNPTLSWNPGDYAPGANGHNVYFGADDPANMVLVSTPAQPQTPNNFDPGALDLGRTYYWAVDEVNVTTPGVNPGRIWSFTVVDYMVVDDFEGYSGNMWQIWIDGAGDCAGNDSNSGAILYEESSITYGGSTASMRYVYDNDGTVETHPCDPCGTSLTRPWYSKGVAQIADLPSEIDPNWLIGGAKALSLLFGGQPNNTIELLWVELEDTGANKAKVFYGAYDDEDPNDFNDGAWHEWSIALDDFNGVDESKVKSITIGIGDEGAASPGETGTVYFDDIRLYPPRCFPLRAKPQADFSSDCEVGYPDLEILTDDWLISGYEFDVAGSVSDANLEVHYEFEDNLNDSSGNLRHADGFGTISYAAGTVGTYAVDLDVNDYAVATGYNGVTGPNSRTCCAWIKTTDVNGGDFISWGTDSDGQKWILRIDTDGDLRAEFAGQRNIVGSTDLRDGQWHHVAVVLDSDGTPEVQDLELYVDGMRELLSSIGNRNEAIDTADGDNLHIGRAPSDWPLRPFEGQIDDLRIYSRALGHDEVAFLAGLTGTIEQPLMPILTTPEDTDLFDDEIINFKDYARLLDEWLDEELWP